MPPPAATQSSARTDLLRLAQASRPWDLLAAAVPWLIENPEDHGVRYLAALSASELGLRTLAEQLLIPLPPEAAADERVRALAAVIQSLPNDEIAWEDRQDNAARAVQALSTRGHELALDLERFEINSSQSRWFKSIDGNTVLWRDPNCSLNGWDWLADHRGAARASVRSTIECDEYNAPPPIVLEGINPPWLLRELLDTLQPTKTGYATPVHVMQSNTAEFIEGLACLNQSDGFPDERLHFHVGPNAGQSLVRALETGADAELPKQSLRTPTTCHRVCPPIEEIVKARRESQQTELATLIQRANAIYHDRDSAWWSSRFESIRRKTGEPLRVVILTSRYTTFVKHSAIDLADAVRAAGGEARVLIEPDDHTRMSRLAHFRSLCEFQPDLFVMINYTRTLLGDSFPRNLPIVSWVQDAMAHLFSEQAANAQGPLDVLIGHHFGELFSQHMYPISRFMHSPVAACDRKFHPGPCADPDTRRFECEIAYVSHHSETPEQLTERLIHETEQPEVGDLLARLAPEVHEKAGQIEGAPLRRALRQSVRHLADKSLASSVPESFVNEVLDQFAIPLAERLVRHEMLGWAARIASDRGWRLHLYGRGWEDHPTLSEHAKGPLNHNDDLRACYQLARAHLHASASPLVHQRLMECALSGGLPLVRLNHEALGDPDRLLSSIGFRPVPESLAPTFEPDPAAHAAYGDQCRLEDHAIGYRLTAHHALLSWATHRQRLGAPPADGDMLWCDPKRVRTNHELRDCGLLNWNAANLFGDLAEHAFTDLASLESKLVRAVEDAPWRRTRSNAVAARVRSHATHSAMLARLIEWFPANR